MFAFLFHEKLRFYAQGLCRLKTVRFCFLFINPNPLTGFVVLRLIREAIGLDNQRTKPSFQYSQLDARNDSCCATSDDICTQLYMS